MKRRNYYLTFALLAGLLFFDSCSKIEPVTQTEIQVDNLKNGDIIPGKYIVRFSSEVMAEGRFKMGMDYNERTQMANDISHEMVKNITGSDCEVEHVFHTVIKGFSGTLSESQVQDLSKDPRVMSIEPDRMFILAPGGGKDGNKGKGGNGGSGEPPAQSLPYGIERVAGSNPADYSGNNVAWIIDSGIDLDHPDLNVNTSLSKSFLTGRYANDPDDGNGHGTHVAGTVAAINNSIGVIGVAPGAEVVAVRVLDNRGSGSYSGVINGIDYVGANGNPGDVANMSLGGSKSTALNDAVKAAASNGIIFCVAAGNDYGSADNYSPASCNATNVYTVSAMNSSDNWASFSNSSCSTVDYCEPGVGIESCWKGGGYNTISGTSMATPHLAGIMLMTGGSPNTDGTVNNDPDGCADPIAVTY